jgi:phospholipid/cholesterol/gamma-HCH transport system permease protein
MPLRTIIGKIEERLRGLGDYAILTTQIFMSALRRPPAFRDVIDQLNALGVQSVGILIPTGLFIGMAMTLLMESEMSTYGAKVYTGRMLSVAAIRELGPVLSCVMMAGRIGARITSELGSMKVTHQIDSVEGLGQDPIQKLVLPRVFALLLAAPALTMITTAVILLGGHLVTSVSHATFWFQVRKSFVPLHMMSAIVKPFAFGLIIASVASFKGLRVTQGVQGVGRAAADAVVTSSVMIFLANYVIGFVILSALGF